MKRAAAAILMILLCMTACSKPEQANAPATPPAQRTARPTQAPQGPHDWWDTHEIFRNFPKYTFGGTQAEQFKDGPRDFMATGQYVQYALEKVQYDDYKAYLALCKESGLSLYDPFAGFVTQEELEKSASKGSAVYVWGSYKLSLSYDIRAQKLIMQIDKIV